MCLSVPARIIRLDGDMARVSIGGTEYEACLALLEEDVHLNDYVLVHTGFAIQKLTEQEAAETFKLLKELEESYGDDELNSA